jgi:hypothetical protein
MHRTAGPHLVAQQPDDAVLHRLRHPAPDAVQRNEIGLRDLPRGRIPRQGGEIGLDEGDVGEPRLGRPVACRGDMGGVEVHRRDMPGGIAGGQQHGTVTLAAAQFQHLHRVVARRQLHRHAAHQAGQRHHRRRLLAVPSRRVGDVGDVTAVPAVHEVCPMAACLCAQASITSESNTASAASAGRRPLPADSGSQVFQPSRGAMAAVASSRSGAT